MLAESLRITHQAGALHTKNLARVTVDTTVQRKAISFPTDAKLLHAAIKGLNRLAKKHGLRLRQSYLRVAKRAAMMAGRYAHAKQFKRQQRQLRFLRARLGRLIRDIGRKIAGQAQLEAAFQWPVARARQIRSQQQRQRGWKLYSFHAPADDSFAPDTDRARPPLHLPDSAKSRFLTADYRFADSANQLGGRFLPSRGKSRIIKSLTLSGRRDRLASLMYGNGRHALLHVALSDSVGRGDRQTESLNDRLTRYRSRIRTSTKSTS